MPLETKESLILNRVAIMGQSYGSYCTLALIVQTARFKAAVISAAILNPDLLAAYLAFPGSKDYYERVKGTWQEPHGYGLTLYRNPPLPLFGKIETPLLIGHEDTALSASDAIYKALRRLGKQAEYRIYKNEGHVISRKQDVIDFWQRRLEYLDEHLHVSRARDGSMLVQGPDPTRQR
ncbi:MAG TPA: prolyl oligopeptidase family serine peptidase [Bryobacteraceae bacterium]|nr:prolyl oligopeptidase family serine peptidase [Bryobacteraceae bacterium]